MNNLIAEEQFEMAPYSYRKYELIVSLQHTRKLSLYHREEKK